MSQGFKRGSKWRTDCPASVFVAYLTIQVATRGSSPNVTTVFHAWVYVRFIEIQRNLRRKKLPRMNYGSNFYGGSFSNRDNERAPIQFRRESQPQHLERWFFFKNRPIHFISIAPVLLDRSNKTSWVFLALKSTSHFLRQSTVSQIRFKVRSQF